MRVLLTPLSFSHIELTLSVRHPREEIPLGVEGIEGVVNVGCLNQ